MTIWACSSENLTNLGGPMGTERTFTNWRKFFRSVENAQKYAEEDYYNHIKDRLVRFRQQKGESPEVAEAAATVEARQDMEKRFSWKSEDGRYRTGDLGFVMYHVFPIKVEDDEDAEPN